MGVWGWGGGAICVRVPARLPFARACPRLPAQPRLACALILVTLTGLHIGVPRSLRGSVPRDVQVRAYVPRGSRVYLRACMPMPACLRACWGWSRLCACLRAGGVRADLCVRASERVGVCGPLFLYTLSLCLSLRD